MMTISDYKQHMSEFNPCQDGSLAFQNCRTRLEVFDLMLSPQGYDFFMKSIRDGWGPRVTDIEATFKNYINGQRISRYENDGKVHYAQMWVGDHKTARIFRSTRRVLLVDFKGELHIEDWQFLEIVTAGDTDVAISSGPNSSVLAKSYGGKISIDKGKLRIKQMN